MLTTLRILVLFLRRSGRRALGPLALTALGVAAATTLILLVLSSLPALDGRSDRMAWREPLAAERGPATALQVRSTEIFERRPIDRVDLALTDGAVLSRVAPPPGLPRFPAPGEVWVSPEMARLLDAHPADRLDRRFPGTVAGRIGPEGLAHRDEAVVVVGRSVADLRAWTSEQGPADELPGTRAIVTEVDGFASHGEDQQIAVYRFLSVLAAVLVAVPALLLIGSAARLAAAHRHQRLATLRLAGATPQAVILLTAAETALAALVGAAAAVLAYAVLIGPAAHIPLAGGPWTRSELWLGPPAMARTLVAVPVVAALSAIAGLRRVSISPLGVRQRVRPAGLRAIRWLAVVGAWALFLLAASQARVGDGTGVVMIGLGAVIASFTLIGPWMAWLLGVTLGRLARRPPLLLAARRIADDPRGAYRAVSGVVLAGFVCGLLLVSLPAVGGPSGDRSERELTVAVPRRGAADRAAAVRDRLAAIDPAVDVEAQTEDLTDHLVLLVVRPGPRADVERLRTAVSDVLPFRPLLAQGDDVNGLRQEAVDAARGSTIVTIATLILATVATAIGAAASVLDQRVTLTRLRLAGAPLETLQRARRWQAALPLGVATFASVGSGAVAGLVLLAMVAGLGRADPGPATVLSLLGLVLSGVVAGVLCAEATRPLLVRATRPDTVGGSG